MSEGKRLRLAIVSSHPIQYNAPVYKVLTDLGDLEIKVFYGWKGLLEGGFDHSFGKSIQWDIPLLDGYEFEFVKNYSKDPGTHHRGGIFLPSLCQKIQDWGAQAILVYGWNFKSHLHVLRFFSGKIPVFFRGDSNLVDDCFGIKKIIRHLVLRWVYSHVSMAFYVGTQNRLYFESLGITCDRLVFAPHAVDNQRFAGSRDMSEREALIWRRNMGIRGNEVVVMFVGKFEAKKSPMDLLSAHSRIPSNDRLHLVFVGNGELAPEMRKAAGPLVHFIDFKNQSEMPVVYHLSDVLVLPSRGPGETWGLVVNEAMACSRAVAASDKVGCAVDLIEDGKNGFNFKATDINGIRDMLKRMVRIGRSGLRTMGVESFERVQSWSFEVQAKNINEAIILYK